MIFFLFLYEFRRKLGIGLGGWWVYIFLKKFDVFEFWCGLIFNHLKHTPAQVYVLIPPRNSAKQKPKEVQSAAKPPAERSEANKVPSEARIIKYISTYTY